MEGGSRGRKSKVTKPMSCTLRLREFGVYKGCIKGLDREYTGFRD